MAHSELAIQCRGLTKRFVVYPGRARGRLAAWLMPWRRDRYRRVVQALRGVDFDVRRGETFGVLGVNGAGKSTLLATVAGLLAHDEGTLAVNGEVDALLQLGTGFHQRFSGRENALIGAISMGVSPREAKQLVAQTLAFAELDDFADMPLYTYSAGMRARLQFAVAIQRQPEILLIDEALSVGDGYFVNKSRRRIEDLCRAGTTVLLVSHSIYMIESLCHRAMILDQGKVIATGEATEVGSRYRHLLAEREVAAAKARTEAAARAPRDVGSGEIILEKVEVFSDEPAGRLFWNRPLTVRIYLDAREPVHDPRFVLQISTAREGILVAHITNEHVVPEERQRRRAELGTLAGRHVLTFRFPTSPFGGNSYQIGFGLMPAVPRRQVEDLADYYVFRSLAAEMRTTSFADDANPLRTVIVEPEVEVTIE